jgi:hypothetical protein
MLEELIEWGKEEREREREREREYGRRTTTIFNVV